MTSAEPNASSGLSSPASTSGQLRCLLLSMTSPPVTCLAAAGQPGLSGGVPSGE